MLIIFKLKAYWDGIFNGAGVLDWSLKSVSKSQIKILSVNRGSGVIKWGFLTFDYAGVLWSSEDFFKYWSRWAFWDWNLLFLKDQGLHFLIFRSAIYFRVALFHFLINPPTFKNPTPNPTPNPTLLLKIKIKAETLSIKNPSKISITPNTPLLNKLLSDQLSNRLFNKYIYSNKKG